MKVLHVTFRYGKEMYGGAELHMRKLSEELLKMGVNVDVCTTRSHGISPLVRSGTKWDNRLDNETINGVNVYRFPVRNPNKYAAMIAEKMIQKRLDQEEYLDEPAIDGYIRDTFDERGAILLGGWNHLERYGTSVMRWTRQRAAFLINDDHIREVTVAFNNPKNIKGKLELRGEGFEKAVPIKGQGPITVDIPDVSGNVFGRIMLDRAWTVLRDFRTLGIYVSGIHYIGDKVVNADLEYDYMKFMVKKRAFVDHMYKRTNSRPSCYCKIFDYLRGPDSPGMVKWLKKHAGDYDAIMAQMFPFNTVRYSVEAKGRTPLVITPLMHVDDDFYHWPHYYDSLRDSEAVFAMSEYSKRILFDRLCPNVTVIGAGIDRDMFMRADVDGNTFREKYGLGDKRLILTVSRKSPGKRYDMLIRAVNEISKNMSDIRLVMIGPDEDKLPINSENVSYLGKLPDSDLVNAYDACDVFAMMSESESFGMVFCEAWSRKKPVIGNVYCGAVASLIDDGKDGYLCNNARDVATKIGDLLNDSSLRGRLGQKGFQKVLDNYTWEKVAQKAYNSYETLIEKVDV